MRRGVAMLVPQLHQRRAALRDQPRENCEIAPPGAFGIDEGIEAKVDAHHGLDDIMRCRDMLDTPAALASRSRICWIAACGGSAARRREMVPFFVQIKCQLGQSYEVANKLADAELASEIYSTAGDFGPAGEILRRGQRTDIGHFVNEKVQTIPGIQDTRTIITFKGVLRRSRLSGITWPDINPVSSSFRPSREAVRAGISNHRLLDSGFAGFARARMTSRKIYVGWCDSRSRLKGVSGLRTGGSDLR